MAKSNSGPNWPVIILVLLAVATAVTVYVLRKQKKDPTEGMTDAELQRYQFSQLNEDQKRAVVDTNRQVLGIIRRF